MSSPTAKARKLNPGNEGVYALCLCRGGSKGVPKKNIRIVAGKPLLAWACGAAKDSGIFEKVVVSTDCGDIKACAERSGFEVHNRDPATATDGASSESGIKDFLKAHPKCKVLCLLQATSPMTTAEDLTAAYRTFTSKGADSLVTVVRAHRFLWKVGKDGMANAQNYAPAKRPLRQEWDGELMENGAFYFFSKASFDKTGSRLSGKVVAHEMKDEAFTEVDCPEDLIAVQEMLKKRESAAIVAAPNPECTIIAEIGINHNGDMDLCKKLIMASKVAGCKYAKIQKRNPDVCVPEAQKSVMRDTPWGKMTYLDYKWKMEFNEEQIKECVDYGNSIGIEFFASVWDKDSVDVMARHTKISKIPSALITDLELCRYAREKFPFLIISTGMSTEAEIEAAYAACRPDMVMHTNSTYPCPSEDLNLNYIKHLQAKFPAAEIGYSGHEFGLVTTFGAVALGATWVERHITWDRKMWGSDQSSSVEIPGLLKLVKGCNAVVEATKYPPGERRLFQGELAKMKSLRPK
jgi:N-acetylneuraminate synthase